MSHLAVRNAIETELTRICAAVVPNPVLFVPTINEGMRPPNAPVWVTVEYSAEYQEKLCYSGGKRIEYGQVVVAVIGRPGQGDDPAIEVLEQIETELNNFYGTAVEITAINGPVEATFGDAAGHYAVELECDYQYTF